MPKVSIIIPCYNIERYLKECLDSVINQTLKDIEIICIDDGSKDNTGKILDEYAKKDNRIKVIHKENSGYGASMNIGIDNASGEYIGIVEPDDYVELDMFEILYTKAIETNVDFVKSDYFLFTEDLIQNVVPLDVNGTYYNKIINPYEDKTVFINVKMNTWSGIYKKDFIKTNNIRYNETPGARYQDQGFWFQTFIYAKSIYIINNPFYHYRFFKTNSTNNPNGFTWIQSEYQFIYELLQKSPNLWKHFKYEYNYSKFKNFFLNFIKLDKKKQKENLNLFHKTFKEIHKNNTFDKSLLDSYFGEQYQLLVNNPSKFYRNLNGCLSFYQKIFSIRNEKEKDIIYKVIMILGIKIKFRKY